MRATFLLCMLSAVLLTSSGYARDPDDSAGVITAVKGNSTFTRPGDEGVHMARKGDRIKVADTLETGKDSGLQLLLNDNSVINISGDTAMRISQYAYDRTKDRQTAVANIMKGTVRFFLLREHTSGSEFRMETRHAFLNVSRADVVVKVSGQQTEVYTLSGNVRVRNTSNLVVGNVQVGENLYTFVQDKSPPSPPSVITPEQKREHSRDARTF